MTYTDFAELKSRVSIEDGVKALGLNLKPSGAQLRGPCPTCKSGGDRALVVTPDKGLFYCWASKKGGDVIALVSHITGLAQPEAAAKLAGGTVPQKRDSSGTVPGTVPRATGFDFEAYAKKLDPTHESLAALGILPDTLAEFHAGYSKAGQNQGRLAVGICDRHGRIVGFVGVALGDESPTMKFPTGINPEGLIFNAHRVGAGEVYLVRGVLDVLRAYESGIENCVCLLTESITAMQLQMLASMMDDKNASCMEMY